MKDGLCPDMPFVVNDWLSSKAVNAMTLAEQGAYLRLLCLAWNEPDCTLPDNESELARLSCLGSAWRKGSGARIRACFPPDPDRPGRIFNERQRKERRKQEERCRKGREQRSAAAKARWANWRPAAQANRSAAPSECLAPATPDAARNAAASPSDCGHYASSLGTRHPAPGEFNSSQPPSFDSCGTWAEASAHLKRLFGERTMTNFGGLWCNRFKEDREKLNRVIADVEEAVKAGKRIVNLGGYADDAWKRFASRRAGDPADGSPS